MTDTDDGDIDPADVEPISDSEGVYQRDGDGEFKPLDWRVIEYDGEQRKIRPYPIPMGDVDELQEMGRDVDIDVLCGVLADKIHTPNRTKSEWLDTDPRLVSAAINELAQMAGGGEAANEMHQQIRDDLDERVTESAATGN